MPIDYEKIREKGRKAGERASDEYHAKVPKKKRIFFWAFVLIGLAAVVSGLASLL